MTRVIDLAAVRTLVPMLVALAAPSAGCGGTLGAHPGAAQNPPDGAVATHDLAVSGGGGGGGQDMNCGGQSFGVTRIPPNVLLVLDRSGSMTQPIKASDPSSAIKWPTLQAAIRSVVGSYDAAVQFGVAFFPAAGGNTCTAGAIGVPVGVLHGSRVLGLLNQTTPGGETPTAATLDTVLAQGQLDDPGRDNFVVLVTDGVPNCGDTDVVGRINKLFAQKAPVKTWVIGVGDGAGAADPVALAAWAQAGHTVRAYSATSPKGTSDAFSTIIAGVVSCGFALANTRPDPSQLYVWLDGKMVAIDAVNGYSYDAKGPSITLHGAACDHLKGVAGSKLQVVYGCPAPPPVM